MKTIVTEKQCRKCGEWKLRDEFYRNKNSLDGLYSYCKSCKDNARKEYRTQHIDKELESNRLYGKQWYQENKEKKNKKSTEWRKAHPEKARENVRRSRIKNADKISEQRKEYRINNLQKLKDAFREWSSRNKEKVVVKSHNRRAKIKNCGGKISVKEWRDLKEKYNYTCLCCGRKEPEIKLTLDHVVPLDIGGPNTIENSQPLCGSCNSSKRTKVIDYR